MVITRLSTNLQALLLILLNLFNLILITKNLKKNKRFLNNSKHILSLAKTKYFIKVKEHLE